MTGTGPSKRTTVAGNWTQILGESNMKHTAVGRLILALVAATIISTCCPVALAQEDPLIADYRVEGNDYISAEIIISTAREVANLGQPLTTEARNQIRDKIMRMGYFDEVVLATESADKGVTVVIAVVEKQRVSQVILVGNTVFSDEELKEQILIREGHLIDDNTIRNDVRRIEDYYVQKGYLAHVSDARVGRYGRVTFVIEEARIEAVKIEGLERTKEYVIRRHVFLEPGQLYQEKQLVKQAQDIFNIGIFEDVDANPQPGVEDPVRGVVVVIEVKEKRTGQFAVAAGYTSFDDLVLVLSVSENNLRGRAERAKADLELFGRTSYEFEYFNPWIDTHGTSFNINLFDTERKRQFMSGSMVPTSEELFDERRSGVNFTFSRPTSQDARTSVTFRSEEVSSSFLQGVRTISGGPIQADQGLVSTAASEKYAFDPGQPDTPPPGDTIRPIRVAAPLHPEGRLTSLTLGHSIDTRNIKTDPTAGAFSRASFEYAGEFLGGEAEFQKLKLEHRMYRELNADGDVLAARVRYGTSFGDLPLFESYALGGISSLRGYDQDTFRGEEMALANIEYRHPLSDALKVVGFVDAGSAWGGRFPTVVPGFDIPAGDQDFNLHAAAGIGLRVKTPIGPIRLDYAYGEEGSELQFGFGHMF